MRLFLGIVILLFCLFLGYCLSGKYYLRRVFYSDFYNFNTLLGQEIAFKQTTIMNLITNQPNNSDFYCLLKKKVLAESFEVNITYLTLEEKSFVSEYLVKIGKFDKKTQLEYLKSINVIVLEKQQNSVLDEKKYKVLYIKLSFLIGLILLIIVL